MVTRQRVQPTPGPSTFSAQQATGPAQTTHCQCLSKCREAVLLSARQAVSSRTASAVLSQRVRTCFRSTAGGCESCLQDTCLSPRLACGCTCSSVNNRSPHSPKPSCRDKLDAKPSEPRYTCASEFHCRGGPPGEVCASGRRVHQQKFLWRSSSFLKMSGFPLSTFGLQDKA